MPERDLPHTSTTDAFNDAIARGVAIIALLGIALIHVVESPDAFTETTYLGILFTLAAAGSVVLAVVLTRTSDRRVWEAAGSLAGIILICYLLSRISGLPAATDDMNNWTEPLGLASMVVEGLLACLAAGVLATHPASSGSAVARVIVTRRPTAPGSHRAPGLG